MRDFLNPKDFYNALCTHGMDYFCGVPDSLLKDFCAYVTSVTPKSRHVITSNEGQAIALAAGYHMATGRAGVVYLQVSVFSLEPLHVSSTGLGDKMVWYNML